MRLQSEISLAATGKRRQYLVRLIKAGRVVFADGTPGDIFIPAPVLQDAVERGLFEGAGCLVDHPGWLQSPSVEKTAGVFSAVTYADGDVTGKLSLYSRSDLAWLAELLDDLVEDAETGAAVPDIGFSLHFYGAFEEDGEGIRRLTEIQKVISCDVVFGPAADGRLLEMLSMARAQLSLNKLLMEEFAMSGTEETKVTYEEGHEPSNEGLLNELVEVFDEQLQRDGDQKAYQRRIARLIEAALSGESQVVDLDSDSQATARLEQKIDDLQSALERLGQGSAVTGMGHAPRERETGTRLEGQVTGLDRAQNDVDWIFGVDGADTPPPNRRSFRDIYVAASGDVAFHGVFDASRVELAGASPVTLPGMAVNAMNKVIIQHWTYLQLYRWFELITKLEPNDGSRHDMQWISFGGVGDLPDVSDGAAYTELEIDDAKESDSWDKKGGYLSITRNMILNSDIQRLQVVPRSLAVAAVRTRSAAVSAIFTSNSGVGPTLSQDSTALFHADHNNLLTTALGSDTTAWNAASLAVFKQTEIGSGKRLGFWPKYCLVPGDLYRQALDNFGYSDAVPTAHDANYNDRGPADPRPVPVAVPDWTDATDWAAIVDPMLFPVIHMTYGQDASGREHPLPEIFTAQSELGGLMFTNDKLPIKVRDEFAVGVDGYRGIHKNNVA